MNKRNMTNLKRRLANRVATADATYHYVAEERNEKNTRSASISYNPRTQTYSLECTASNPKQWVSWPTVGPVREGLTLERVLELAEKFVDTGKN